MDKPSRYLWGPLTAAGVAVAPKLAAGKKCARSWKVLESVGTDPDFPDVSPRDAQALREWEAMRKAAE